MPCAPWDLLSFCSSLTCLVPQSDEAVLELLAEYLHNFAKIFKSPKVVARMRHNDAVVSFNSAIDKFASEQHAKGIRWWVLSCLRPRPRC